jgi:hypothetical protein
MLLLLLVVGAEYIEAAHSEEASGSIQAPARSPNIPDVSWRKTFSSAGPELPARQRSRSSVPSVTRLPLC